jgi:hypothetical protein
VFVSFELDDLRKKLIDVEVNFLFPSRALQALHENWKVLHETTLHSKLVYISKMCTLFG